MAELAAEIARCPTTGGPLERVADGLRNSEGHVYPVSGGVAGLMPQRAGASAVQRFYDEVGWQKDGEVFEDTARFVESSPSVERYLARGRQRIGTRLPATGTHLLDIASGPVQFPEYVDYHAGFEYRICVDFSTLALREARANIGEKGILVQGDITAVPLADGSVDAAVSLHTIYHVPREEQPTAFRELHRVLAPGGVAVVAYSWGHTAWDELTPVRKMLHMPARLLGRARRTLRSRSAPAGSRSGEPELYFHAFDHHWFVRQPWPFRYEIVVNRLFMTATLERLARVPGLLAAVERLEQAFPRTAGRFGRYPLILIFKD